MKDTGGPAFPNEGFNGWGKPFEGMTLRDYFAACALQGWIASQPKIMGETLDGTDEMAKVLADAAYTMADAMLKAREERNN